MQTHKVRAVSWVSARCGTVVEPEIGPQEGKEYLDAIYDISFSKENKEYQEVL